MNLFMKSVFTFSLVTTVHANELDAVRPSQQYDACKPYEAKNEINTFREQIRDWVDYYSSHEVKLALEEIYPYYAVKNGLNELSLHDLNYCELDQNALSRSLKNVPDQTTISSLNNFFQNNTNYEKLFSCLAMEESLGDPDTAVSQRVYQNATGRNDKPKGVKFYIDREQPKESQLNIGLFQFTPNINGNIHSCVLAWNELFNQKQNCQIKNNSDVLNALSTSGQNFNVFCGIHKIIETSAVQMKSEKSSAHFKAGEACVSLQMRAGLAYNHFGPLQNSTGKNLASLARCLNSTI